jgi:hypothetical protein
MVIDEGTTPYAIMRGTDRATEDSTLTPHQSYERMTSWRMVAMILMMMIPIVFCRPGVGTICCAHSNVMDVNSSTFKEDSLASFLKMRCY